MAVRELTGGPTDHGRPIRNYSLYTETVSLSSSPARFAKRY